MYAYYTVSIYSIQRIKAVKHKWAREFISISFSLSLCLISKEGGAPPRANYALYEVPNEAHVTRHVSSRVYADVLGCLCAIYSFRLPPKARLWDCLLLSRAAELFLAHTQPPQLDDFAIYKRPILVFRCRATRCSYYYGRI